MLLPRPPAHHRRRSNGVKGMLASLVASRRPLPPPLASEALGSIAGKPGFPAGTGTTESGQTAQTAQAKQSSTGFPSPSHPRTVSRRKSLIRRQKRAAAWKHGFESRWGHHPKSSEFLRNLGRLRRAAETSENRRIAPNPPAAWQRNGSGSSARRPAIFAATSGWFSTWNSTGT